MATLIQRGTRGIWTAVWYAPEPTSPTGTRQRWQSTKLTNKKEAQKLADHWEEASKAEVASDNFRIKTAEIQRKLSGHAKVVTVPMYLDQWLERTAMDVKPVTKRWYASKQRTFQRWLDSKQLGNLDIAQVQRAHIDAFLLHERHRLDAKTVNHTLKYLRAVFKDATIEGLIVTNPTLNIDVFRENTHSAADRDSKGPKINREDRRPFTVEELAAVLKACPPEWESMVMFGLYTAQRLRDIATMRERQIDLLSNEVVFKTSKTGAVVRPAIGEAFSRWLLARASTDDPEAPVHPQAFAAVGRTGETSTLSNQFAAILAAAGLRPKQSHTTKKEDWKGRAAKRNAHALSFHCLRHTHTTWLKQAGASEAVAMDNVGHDSGETSEIYTHIDAATRKKFADLMPDIRRTIEALH